MDLDEFKQFYTPAANTYTVGYLLSGGHKYGDKVA
jgi:hypothetical protein